MGVTTYRPLELTVLRRTEVRVPMDYEHNNMLLPKWITMSRELESMRQYMGGEARRTNKRGLVIW